MNTKEYTEKEIAILNATVDLMKGGINPYLIKVSDIAETANIGKGGTIYDYFNSKEEVISTAIVYNIDNEIKTGYERIKTKKILKTNIMKF